MIYKISLLHAFSDFKLFSYFDTEIYMDFNFDIFADKGEL